MNEYQLTLIKQAAAILAVVEKSMDTFPVWEEEPEHLRGARACLRNALAFVTSAVEEAAYVGN